MISNNYGNCNIPNSRRLPAGSRLYCLPEPKPAYQYFTQCITFSVINSYTNETDKAKQTIYS